MSGLLIFIYILLILLAIVLIVSVLMQEGNRAGLGAIGGGAETFFGKSKAKGVQGKLELITKIGAAVFIVLAIVATALTAAQTNSTDVTDPAALVDESQTEEGAIDTLPDVSPVPDDATAQATPEAAAAVEATPEVTEAPVVATEAPTTTEAPAA